MSLLPSLLHGQPQNRWHPSSLHHHTTPGSSRAPTPASLSRQRYQTPHISPSRAYSPEIWSSPGTGSPVQDMGYSGVPSMEDTRGITEVWEALREVLAAQSGIYALLNDIRHDIDRSERSVSERLDAMSDVILGFQPQAQQPTEPPKTREQCPDVLFWDQEPWETMSNGKHGDSSPAASALLQLPSSETVIAKKLRFIQTDLGVLVSPERLGAITQGGRGQFEKMILAKVAPYNWETNVSADVRDDFCLSMERAYPELGLCSNHWKANKLAIIIYPGFKRTRRVYFDALRKVMKKDKGKNKSSAEPEDDEGEDVSEDERGDEGDTPTGEQQEEGQQRPHAALPTRKEKRAATTSDQSLQPRKKKKTENSWISSLRKTQLQPEASRNVSSMPVAPGGPSSVPSEELSVVSTSFEASSGVHTSSRVAGLPEPLCSIADSASHPDVSPTSSTAGATEPGASLTSSPLHSSSAPSGPRSSSTPSVSGASPTVSASVPSSIPSALGLSPTPSPPGSSAASSPSASLSAHSASGSLSNPSASGCSSSPASSSLRDSSLAPQASASGSSARPQSVASSLSTTTSARAPSSSSRSILLQSPRSPPPEGMRDAAPNSGVSLRDPSPDPSRPEISSSAAPGPDPHVQERAGSSAGPNPTPASSSSESPSGSTIDGQPAHPKGKLYQPGPRNTMKNLFGRDWIATRSGTEAEFKKAYKAFEEDEPRKTAFIKNLESMNVKIVQAGGRRRATEGSHPSCLEKRGGARTAEVAILGGCTAEPKRSTWQEQPNRAKRTVNDVHAFCRWPPTTSTTSTASATATTTCLASFLSPASTPRPAPAISHTSSNGTVPSSAATCPPRATPTRTRTRKSPVPTSRPPSLRSRRAPNVCGPSTRWNAASEHVSDLRCVPSERAGVARSPQDARSPNTFRCAVPVHACRVPHPSSKRALNVTSNPYRSYAFVEFRSTRDAEDAYYEMHGRNFDGARLSIQWAKNPPSSVWRYDRRSPPRRDRDRSRSPRRNGRDRSDRDRDRDRERERERPRERDRDRDERDRDRDRDEKPRRSRSPERRRSPTPERRRDDRARTPPPLEEGKKEEDRAQTPPYDN